jgi:hypothetical protein
MEANKAGGARDQSCHCRHRVNPQEEDGLAGWDQPGDAPTRSVAMDEAAG